MGTDKSCFADQLVDSCFCLALPLCRHNGQLHYMHSIYHRNPHILHSTYRWKHRNLHNGVVCSSYRWYHRGDSYLAKCLFHLLQPLDRCLLPDHKLCGPGQSNSRSLSFIACRGRPFLFCGDAGGLNSSRLQP